MAAIMLSGALLLSGCGKTESATGSTTASATTAATETPEVTETPSTEETTEKPTEEKKDLNISNGQVIVGIDFEDGEMGNFNIYTKGGKFKMENVDNKLVVHIEDVGTVDYANQIYCWRAVYTLTALMYPAPLPGRLNTVCRSTAVTSTPMPVSILILVRRRSMWR